MNTWLRRIAVGGLMLSLVPAALVAVGLASVDGGTLGLWPLTAVIAGPLTLLSAAAATGTLAVARIAEKRQSPNASAVAQVEPAGVDTQARLK